MKVLLSDVDIAIAEKAKAISARRLRAWFPAKDDPRRGQALLARITPVG
jgi:hypothetical protein